MLYKRGALGCEDCLTSKVVCDKFTRSSGASLFCTYKYIKCDELPAGFLPTFEPVVKSRSGASEARAEIFWFFLKEI